ncbi:hypothetical protein [Actinoplanes sp. G11-F43]|uniref:hypothetical protein n=1 Tax=Actinoplanes sp. G11-F43 TaxID=3424130 RepID=UPI003D333C20
MTPDGVVYRPVVDLARMTGTLLATIGAIAVAVAVSTAAAHRRPEIGTVTMGPGGWVSVKRAPTPRLRPTERRPWWAHLLGAHRVRV